MLLAKYLACSSDLPPLTLPWTPEGPRHAYDDGAEDWINRATDESPRPRDLSDAIAMAFTSACDRLLRSIYPKLHGVEPQPLRAAYDELREPLDMRRDTFRLTYQGARWLSLPELQAVLEEEKFGFRESFLNDLGRLLPLVLDRKQMDGFPLPTDWIGRSLSMLDGEEVISVSYVAGLEAQARDMIAGLALIQSRDMALRDKFSADWDSLDRTVGWSRLDRKPPNPMLTQTLNGWGFSISDLVADAIRDAKSPMKHYQIVSDVGQVVELIMRGRHERPEKLPASAVSNALSYLSKRGEIRREDYGYTATEKVRPPAGPEPAPKESQGRRKSD